MEELRNCVKLMSFSGCNDLTVVSFMDSWFCAVVDEEKEIFSDLPGLQACVFHVGLLT